MTRRLTFYLLFFLLTLAARISCGAPLEYWISFTSYRQDRSSAGPKYLMKIDVFGNVLIPARKVVPELGYASPPYGATALSQTDGFLLMWMPERREDPQQPTTNAVFRALINKQTLRLVLFRKTKLNVYNKYALQVTQRKQDNFLVLEGLDPDIGVRYFGVPLSPTGKILPGRLDLFPNPVTCPCEMGISADGRIFFFRDQIGTKLGKFVVQRLNHAGDPVQAPAIVATGRTAPADISNRVHGNQRFALYFGYPTLDLQVLDADTLENIGDPVHLAKNTGVGNQTAAIDPHGRFVLYTTATEHPAGSRLLMYQALDALGHPSGQPKIIAHNVQSGLDVLKDRP